MAIKRKRPVLLSRGKCYCFTVLRQCSSSSHSTNKRPVETIQLGDFRSSTVVSRFAAERLLLISLADDEVKVIVETELAEILTSWYTVPRNALIVMESM